MGIVLLASVPFVGRYWLTTLLISLVYLYSWYLSPLYAETLLILIPFTIIPLILLKEGKVRWLLLSFLVLAESLLVWWVIERFNYFEVFSQVVLAPFAFTVWATVLDIKRVIGLVISTVGATFLI